MYFFFFRTGSRGLEGIKKVEQERGHNTRHQFFAVPIYPPALLNSPRMYSDWVFGRRRKPPGSKIFPSYEYSRAYVSPIKPMFRLAGDDSCLPLPPWCNRYVIGCHTFHSLLPSTCIHLCVCLHFSLFDPLPAVSSHLTTNRSVDFLPRTARCRFDDGLKRYRNPFIMALENKTCRQELSELTFSQIKHYWTASSESGKRKKLNEC